MDRTHPWSALLVILLTACGGNQLQHGLEERDANELVATLVSRGFQAAKVPEKGKKPTWAVEVDEAQATDALQVLAELRLPRVAHATTRTLAQGAGLIETPAGERLRQLAAQAGDLEEALETMSGVSQASVELAVPPPGRAGQAPAVSKAAVLLRVRPEALERLTLARAELRALVAAGVEGLRAEEVVLVLDPVALQASPAVPAPPGRALAVAVASGVALLAVVLLTLALLLRRQRRRGGLPAAAEPAPPGLAAPGPRALVGLAAPRRVG